MEIKIEKRVLSEALTRVGRAITGRVNTPILDGVYMSATAEGLQLIGSDSNITISTKIEDVQVIEEGAVVLEPRILGEIVRKLPEAEIHLKTEENLVTIKCLKSEFNIMYSPAEEYPSDITIEEGSQLEVEQRVIKNMVKSVQFAASENDTRPVLKGILFEAKDCKLNLVALDGYRLSKKSLELNDETDITAIMEAKSFGEIARLMSDTDEMVEIKITRNHAVFKFQQTLILLRMLEGTFVNYAALMPSDFKTKVKINRTEFIASLERASLMSDSNNHLAKVDVVGEKVIVSANSQLGKLKEEITISRDGDLDLTIAFNTRFVLDALKVIDDSEIVMDLTSAVAPCIIRGAEDSTGEYLILPVRLI